MRKLLFILLVVNFGCNKDRGNSPIITPNVGAGITIGPYLQTPTSNSIYVCWQTDSGAESKVQYGLTNGLGSENTGSSYSFSPTTIWHWVKLTGLTANTPYYYKCITGTSETPVVRFRTQPLDGETNTHVRFGVYGDNQGNYSHRHDTLVVRMKTKMAELFGTPLEDKVNVIMNTGDIVEIGKGANFDKFRNEFFDPMKPISGNIPTMVTLGGHEGLPRPLDFTNYYTYLKYADVGGADGEKYYSFRISRVLFVVLNYEIRDSLPNQDPWLKTVLDQAEQDNSLDWVFIFVHGGFNSELWPYPYGPGNQTIWTKSIMPYAQTHPKVAATFSGHTHGYERGQAVDCPVYRVITGGGAGTLDKWGRYTNYSDIPVVQKAYDHYNYVIVDVDCANKSFKAWAYDLGTPEIPKNNVLLDNFYMKRANTSPPDKPIATSSAGFLNASAYSGVEPLQSSHFQLTSTKGNYSSPLLESIRDYEDVYQFADRNAGIDLSKLSVSLIGNYWWRVRYRDRNLQWSEWSDEKNFNTN